MSSQVSGPQQVVGSSSSLTTSTNSTSEPDAPLTTNENSANSWNGSSSNSAARRAAEQKLSVVLPANQKSLLTPTIVTSEPGGPSPTHLFSSLIQLNGHEVGLFTGLPGCTPTSADSLAKGNLSGINPFFWGVSSFGTPPINEAAEQQQVNKQRQSQQQQQQESSQTTDGKTSPSKQRPTSNQADHQVEVSEDEAIKQQRLNKLSLDQLQAANAILSPLSLFLSPDGLRFGLPSQHPLAGRTGARDLAAKAVETSTVNTNCLQLTDEQLRAAAQDLTSQVSNQHQQQLLQHQHQHQQTQPTPQLQPAQYQQQQQQPPSQPHGQHLSEISTNQTYNGSVATPFETYLHHQTAAANHQHQHLNVAARTADKTGSGCVTLNNATDRQQVLISSTSNLPTAETLFRASHPQQVGQLVPRGVEFAPNASTRQPQIVYQTSHDGQTGYIQGQLVPAILQPTSIEQSIGLRQDTCVPPVAHHQQQQAAFMVIGNHRSSNPMVNQTRGIHPEQPMSFYEPRFRHFYLSHQQQQQQSYNLQQQQHQQHQQNFQDLALRPQHPQPYQVHSTGNTYTAPRPQVQPSSYVSAQAAAPPRGPVSNANSSCSLEASPSQHTHSNGASPARSNTSLDTTNVDDVSGSSFTQLSAQMTSIQPAAKTATEPEINSPVVPAPVARNNKKAPKKTSSLGKEPDSSNGEVVKKKSKGGRKKKMVTHDELLARKNRSKERNRVAAKRCRQKRKQFLDELCGRIDDLNDMNKKLQRENNMLKNELDALKQRLSAQVDVQGKSDTIRNEVGEHLL